MKNLSENIFKWIIKILTSISLLLLAFIVIFIFKEGMVFFKEVSIIKFVSGRTWEGRRDKWEGRRDRFIVPDYINHLTG